MTYSTIHTTLLRRRHATSSPPRRRYIDPYIPTDEATAASAVRNLSAVEVNGRQLRVEASTDEPGPRGRQEGGRGGGRRGGGGGGGRDRDHSPPGGRYGGPPGGGGQGYAPPMGMGMGGGLPAPPLGQGAGEPAPRLDLGLLPPGQDIPPNMGKSTDAISKTLAAVSPGQMQDVMAGMKVSYLLIYMFMDGYMRIAKRDIINNPYRRKEVPLSGY